MGESARPEWQQHIDYQLFSFAHSATKLESLAIKREELEATEPGSLIGCYGWRQPGGSGGVPGGPQVAAMGINHHLEKVVADIHSLNKFRDHIQGAITMAVESFKPDDKTAESFIHAYWLAAPFTSIVHRRDITVDACRMSKATFYRWRDQIYDRLEGLL